MFSQPLSRRHALNGFAGAEAASVSRGHVGHSIGLDDQVEEPPFIVPDDAPFEPGMVMSLEVPYYANSLGGFNIEDMVLCHTNGMREPQHPAPQTDLSCGMNSPDAIRGGRR